MLSNGGFGVRNIKPEDREDFLRMSREFYNSPAVLHNIPDEFHTRAFQELMEQSPYARCFMLMCGEVSSVSKSIEAFSSLPFKSFIPETDNV